MARTFCGLLLIALLCSACAPWHRPPGPPTVAPVLSATYVLMADGAALPLRRWLPVGPPRAVVLALHGFNDYSRAFQAPAAHLAKAGIAVYAYDQRGFGSAPNRGFWSSVDGMTGDMRAAASLVRAAHPDRRFYILGESMGAAVVLAAMGEGAGPPQADGYILSAPAVWGRRVMPVWQRVGLEFLAHTIPLFHVTGQGFNRTPSDNIEMLKKLGRDKLVIKYTRIDTLYGLVDLMDAALDAAPKMRGRTLILLGSQEDIMPEGAMQALLTALPKAECVRVARYQAGFHMLLRDLQAATVLADIAAWIGDPATALPSGADRAMTASEQEAAKEPETKQVSGATAPLALSCHSPIAARP